MYAMYYVLMDRCVPAATCVPKNFTIKQDSLEDAASCLEPSNTCCHVNNIVDDDYGSSNDPVPCTSLSDHRYDPYLTPS